VLWREDRVFIHALYSIFEWAYRTHSREGVIEQVAFVLRRGFRFLDTSHGSRYTPLVGTVLVTADLWNGFKGSQSELKDFKQISRS
jgi:hypothetical protein